MNADDDDLYYESLAHILEGARDPRTHPVTLELILQILGRVDGVDEHEGTAAARHLEIMGQINRMRAHLSDETYKFLMHHFRYEQRHQNRVQDEKMESANDP